MGDIKDEKQEIIIKEEVDTQVIEVPLNSSVSSVLDELQDLFDSFGDSKTENFVDEDIDSLDHDEKGSDNDENILETIRGDVDLSCEDCVFETNSENILNLHRNYLHGTNLPVKGSLNIHVKIKPQATKRNVSSNVVTRHCYICSFEGNSLRELIEHYGKEHNGEKIFKCDICKYESNWPVNMKNHKESVHDPKIYECESCDYKNKWKAALLEHKREKHGIFSRPTKYTEKTNGPVKCDLCDYLPKTSKRLQVHKIKYHKERKYTTKSKSNKKEKSAIQLSQTKSSKQRKSLKKNSKPKQTNQAISNSIQCDECQLVFKSSASKWRHKTIQHEGRTYPCNECEYKSSYQQGLAAHKSAKHEGKSVKCDLCEQNFKYMGDLKRHKDYKHNGLFHSCGQCGAKHQNLSQLEKHTKVAHEGYRYKCIACNREFKRKDQLKEHTKVMHENYGYFCNECGESFTCQDSLKKHIRISHQGEASLRRHAKTIHEEDQLASNALLYDKSDLIKIQMAIKNKLHAMSA